MAEPHNKIALYSIRIDCEGCVKKIQKVLKKARGVELYTINKSANTLQVIGQIDEYEILKMLRKKDKGKTITLLEVKEEEKKEEKKEENNEEASRSSLIENNEEASRSSSASMVAVDKFSHNHAVPAAYQQNPDMFCLNEEQVTMFSDENPNACLIM